MFNNGREVIVELGQDDWGYSLMDYFGDEEEELGILIEDWLPKTLLKVDSIQIILILNIIEQVRIPLFTERNGRQRIGYKELCFQ